MMFRILGTAAGGGSPQWNCACEQCLIARRRGSSRGQECAVFSGNGVDWYLINASPDLRTQLLACPELGPGPGLRDTPLRAALLTDAELDHTLGLFSLREARRFDVFGTAPVLAALESALPVRRVVAPYGQEGWCWHTVGIGHTFDLPGPVSVTAFALGGKRPRYAGEVDGQDWVVGYRITGGGRIVVYAPCFEQWTDVLDVAVKDADVAVIDGTFATAQEMPHIRGHLPVADSSPQLARHPGTRFVYTHLNNTNPLLSDDRGLRVATEMELL